MTKFLNNLTENVLNTYQFVKYKKFNSVILNYDPHSVDFFNWYQQLVSESLGKNSKGILPIISNMPKDNHSILQLYLSGFKSNFFPSSQVFKITGMECAYFKQKTNKTLMAKDNLSSGRLA